MIDQHLLELGVGAVIAYIIIREVLTFLSRRGLNGSDGTVASALMGWNVKDIKAIVIQTKDKVDDLYDWHNVKDLNGVPLWYMKPSLEDAVRELAKSMDRNIDIQTKILDHMQKKEEYLRDLLKGRQ